MIKCTPCSSGSPPRAWGTLGFCRRLVSDTDIDTVKPQGKAGWIYADLVRVPSAACPSQQAVVRLWRHDAKAAPPQLDAQGRSRLYLKESVDAVRQNGAGDIPAYAVEMGVAGKPCG